MLKFFNPMMDIKFIFPLKILRKKVATLVNQKILLEKI